jgi:hypothetical protein
MSERSAEIEVSSMPRHFGAIVQLPVRRFWGTAMMALLGEAL